MMNLEDYALDVGKTVEEIMSLCDKIGIKYEDSSTVLDDTDITLLDNELQDQEDYIEGDIEDLESKLYEEEVYDKAEELAMNTKFDLDNSTSFEKVKPKSQKKNDSKKNDFFKERKKIYKHREKLQKNEAAQDDNIILYKNGMTVSELAGLLNVAAVELVKKLMGLGVMANINQSVDFETAEVLVADYGKTLKKEETADISNLKILKLRIKKKI